MTQKVLILGGTLFVGRHLLEQLQQRSDLELTLFHRGRSNPELFPELKHVLGDRNTDDVKQLLEQDWDVVVDFSCYYPRPLAELLTAFSGRVGRYVLVSTISVYDLDAFAEGDLISEASPTVSCTPDEEVDTTLFTYGKRKWACEQVLLQHSELQPVVFRPGLIYGPYDYTDRAYYWLWRVQRGQEFLVADPQLRQQWTYAVDFARLIAAAVTGPQPQSNLYLALTHEPASLAEQFQAMAEACGSVLPSWQTVSEEWMGEQALNYWQDLPLTLPFERIFDRSAVLRDFALDYASLTESWRVCRDYYASLNWPEPKTGLSLEREQQLLHDF